MKVKKNKKMIIIGSVTLLLVISLLVWFFVINKTNEKELLNRLEEIGRNFYENEYYVSLGNDEELIKNHLKNYEKVGIKIDLENLSKFNSFENIKKEFVNSETDENCDYVNSKITIYPIDEYDKMDYNVTVELKCGFAE